MQASRGCPVSPQKPCSTTAPCLQPLHQLHWRLRWPSKQLNSEESFKCMRREKHFTDMTRDEYAMFR